MWWFIEEKCMSNGEIRHFLVEPATGIGIKSWYRYPLCKEEVVLVPLKVVAVPIDRRGLVPVQVPTYRTGLVPIPMKVIPIPMLPATLFLFPLHF